MITRQNSIDTFDANMPQDLDIEIDMMKIWHIYDVRFIKHYENMTLIICKSFIFDVLMMAFFPSRKDQLY